MENIDEAIVAAQALVDGLTALKANTPALPVVEPDAVEVDLVLTDGSTKKFVPAPAQTV